MLRCGIPYPIVARTEEKNEERKMVSFFIYCAQEVKALYKVLSLKHQTATPLIFRAIFKLATEIHQHNDERTQRLDLIIAPDCLIDNRYCTGTQQVHNRLNE
jgi:hypothetical protein